MGEVGLKSLEKIAYEFYGWSPKGQLIFEMSYWCLQIDQKTNENFLRISALASNKEFKSKMYCMRAKIKSSN